MFKKIIKSAFPHTVPILFGYLAIGIPFGINVVVAGYPWWLALFMSVFMFAGAGQYMAVGLFVSGATLPEILLAEALLNIRHIVYGLSLIKPFKGSGIYKPYLIFGLSDETYALQTSVEVPDGIKPKHFYTAIAALDQSYWVMGSVIGAAACSVLKYYNLDSYLAGIDFSLTALFVVIMVDQIKKSKDFLPSAIGLVTCGISVVLWKIGVLPSSNIVLSSIAFGIAAITLFKGRSFFRTQKSAQQKTEEEK